MHVMNRLLALAYALPLALLFGLPDARAEAQAAHEHQKHGKEGASMMECQTMMEDRERMMSEIHAANARLDELVAAMNAANGEAKLEALARVVTELAEQRKLITGKMTAMQPQM